MDKESCQQELTNPKAIVKVSEEDRLVMLEAIDQINANSEVMGDAIRHCIHHSVVVKKKLRRLWVEVKKKHNLDGNIKYSMDKNVCC